MTTVGMTATTTTLSTSIEELRCPCGKLLATACNVQTLQIRIKCPRCRNLYDNIK